VRTTSQGAKRRLTDPDHPGGNNALGGAKDICVRITQQSVSLMLSGRLPEAHTRTGGYAPTI